MLRFVHSARLVYAVLCVYAYDVPSNSSSRPEVPGIAVEEKPLGDGSTAVHIGGGCNSLCGPSEQRLRAMGPGTAGARPYMSSMARRAGACAVLLKIQSVER